MTYPKKYWSLNNFQSEEWNISYFHFFALVTGQSAMLSSATQHTLSRYSAENGEFITKRKKYISSPNGNRTHNRRDSFGHIFMQFRRWVYCFEFTTFHSKHITQTKARPTFQFNMQMSDITWRCLVLGLKLNYISRRDELPRHHLAIPHFANSQNTSRYPTCLTLHNKIFKF